MPSPYSDLFSILTETDSTQNYATGKLRAGLAKHGQAWLALSQTAGKAQRGRSWISEPGKSLTFSLIIQPPQAVQHLPFCLSASIALSVAEVLQEQTGKSFSIKWPNDIYFGDKKAGGILIENIFKGTQWNYAIVGIGLNLNQQVFPPDIPNPVSVYQITGKEWNAETLGRLIHERVLLDIKNLECSNIISRYNTRLYKRNLPARLKKDGAVFETTILYADKFGKLHTTDAIDRSFEFGEISWLIS